MIQALIAGSVVLLAAWLIMGSGLELSVQHPLVLITLAVLVALLSAAGGLALGCSVGQTQVGLMFSLVLAPMIMFGCTYYPWSALSNFPALQYVVLANPMVYASEGLRASLVPQFPHLRIVFVMAVLFAIDMVLVFAGMHRFRKKAVG
jgi:ABC-2 type transport system permease protein